MALVRTRTHVNRVSLIHHSPKMNFKPFLRYNYFDMIKRRATHITFNRYIKRELIYKHCSFYNFGQKLPLMLWLRKWRYYVPHPWETKHMFSWSHFFFTSTFRGIFLSFATPMWWMYYDIIDFETIFHLELFPSFCDAVQLFCWFSWRFWCSCSHWELYVITTLEALIFLVYYVCMFSILLLYLNTIFLFIVFYILKIIFAPVLLFLYLAPTTGFFVSFLICFFTYLVGYFFLLTFV